jgi:hypothetical protein
VTVPNLVLVRFGRALGQVGGTLQQDRRRRRLGDEAVGPVGVDGDDDRNDQALVLAGLRVEVLAEVHDIDAVGTQRGSHRRRRGWLSPAAIWSFTIACTFFAIVANQLSAVSYQQLSAPEAEG